jgi:hypothetical protein
VNSSGVDRVTWLAEYERQRLGAIRIAPRLIFLSDASLPPTGDAAMAGSVGSRTAARSDLQEDFAAALHGELLYRAYAIAELRQSRYFAGAHVDQHCKDAKFKFVFALA